MKILFLDHTGQLGGAELFLLDIAARERESLVITFEPGPFVDALRAKEVEVVCLAAPVIDGFRRNSGLLAMMSLGPTLLKLLFSITNIARGFDLIYANSKKAAPLGLLAGFVLGKPVFVHIHDILDKQHFSRFSRALFLTMTNLLAHTVVTNSTATSNAFVELGGDKKKVAVVNNGFDLNAFPSISSQEASMLKSELGLNGEEPIIGCIGRISKGKGQTILLDALAVLPQNIQGLLVGSAPFGEDNYLTELQTKAARPELSGRVKFAGFRSDISQIMQICDVIVHPAIHPEAFGRTIVEAQLVRKPAIATDTGGVNEIVEDGETGLLCKPNDANQLREKIDLILSDKTLRDKIVEAGYKHAAKRFSIEETFRQFDAMLATRLSTIKKPQ